jgi:hypothetical protein
MSIFSKKSIYVYIYPLDLTSSDYYESKLQSNVRNETAKKNSKKQSGPRQQHKWTPPRISKFQIRLLYTLR